MYVTDDTILREIPEPADGSVLVVETSDGKWRVIWRDDAAAARWGGRVEARWFTAGVPDPARFVAHLWDAAAVFPLGAPLVRFTDRGGVVR